MQKISYLLLALFLFVVDQISKWWITEQILKPNTAIIDPSMGLLNWYQNTPPRLPFTSIELLPFFNLVMVWNQGVSFGLFSNSSNVGPYILSAVSAAISAIFLVWLFKTHSKLQSIAIALVISGALGNVIDRLRFGAVIDFLDFHVSGYHWPAFNIADSAIVIGVFLLMVHAFFFDSPMKDNGKDAKTAHIDENE